MRTRFSIPIALYREIKCGLKNDSMFLELSAGEEVVDREVSRFGLDSQCLLCRCIEGRESSSSLRR